MPWKGTWRVVAREIRAKYASCSWRFGIRIVLRRGSERVSAAGTDIGIKVDMYMLMITGAMSGSS